VLGRKLLTHVADIMRPVQDVPVVGEETPVTEALVAVSRGRLGMTAVQSADGKVCGIFTDGDLRRAIERHGDLRQVKVGAVMKRSPRTIEAGRLAVEAAQLMEQYSIHSLLVVDDDGRLLGAFDIHDLFRAKVV
jgi:arabinose-5-phosphate isomerase